MASNQGMVRASLHVARLRLATTCTQQRFPSYQAPHALHSCVRSRAPQAFQDVSLQLTWLFVFAAAAGGAIDAGAVQSPTHLRCGRRHTP